MPVLCLLEALIPYAFGQPLSGAFVHYEKILKQHFISSVFLVMFSQILFQMIESAMFFFQQ
jgi:hypothetical protein